VPSFFFTHRAVPSLDVPEMKVVVKDISKYTRWLRSFLSPPKWPEFGLRQPALSHGTVTKSLRDDLKLFADEMMRRVGQDYFLLTMSRHRAEMAHARAFQSAGENWRDLAQVDADVDE
jgi:hypothetical protein